MSDQSWYVNTEAGQDGPFTEEELRTRLASGELTPGHYVWRDGMADWTTIEVAGIVTSQVGADVAPAARAPSGGTEVASDSAEPPPRKRSRGRKVLGGLLILLLLIGIGAGGYYAYTEYFTEKGPLDFAAALPPGVIGFIEADMSSYDEPRQAALRRHYDEYKKMARNPDDLPAEPPSGFRVGLGVYGGAELQGRIPTVVAFAEFVDEPTAELFEQQLAKQVTLTPEEEKEHGWTVVKAVAKDIEQLKDVEVYIASDGVVRIAANNRRMLGRVLALIESDEENPASLAATPSFRSAMESLPPGNQGRGYVDLAGVIRDLHPLLSIVGGDTYQEIKTTYLDGLKYYAFTNSMDGADQVSEGVLALSNGDVFFGEDPDLALHWPAAEIGPVNSISLALAVPKIARDRLPELAMASYEKISKSKKGSAMGLLGSINAALSMYFADNKGKYPVAKEPTKLGEIGLHPVYINLPAAAHEYLYESDGAVYTVTAVIDGVPVVTYSSGSGRTEEIDAPAAENGADTEDAKPDFENMFSGLKEIVVSAQFENMEPKWALAVRGEESALKTLSELAAEQASEDVNLELADGWLFGGTAEQAAAVEERLSGAAPRAGAFLSMGFNFDMEKMIPEGLDVPTPLLKMSSTIEASYSDNAIKMTARVSPDMTPLSHAMMLVYLFGGGIDSPEPISPGLAPTPQKPAPAPSNDEASSEQPEASAPQTGSAPPELGGELQVWTGEDMKRHREENKEMIDRPDPL